MVGLILLLLQTGGGPVARPLGRLETLLLEPQPASLGWRKQVFQTLRRLESAPSPEVVAKVQRGWEFLASTGQDKNRADLVLYQRRHDLPLLASEPGEGPETVLERCLADWGREDGTAARARLRKAVSRFPEDARFAENLLWVDLQAPVFLDLDASPRNMALAVLSSPFRNP